MQPKQLTDWELCGYDPYIPLYDKCMEIGKRLAGVTPVLRVKVPGSIYQYLQKEKLIPDPFYEKNSLACEWVANRWWVYKTQLDIPENIHGRLRLTFQGIDYHALIYVGDKQVAEHIGMFVPCTVDITDYVTPGTLVTIGVIVMNAPDEFGQIGATSRTSTQKARFSYKWDFCFRMVQLGLYDAVLLEEVPETDITHWYFRAHASGGGELSAELEGKKRKAFRLEAGLYYKGRKVWDAVSDGILNGKKEVVRMPLRIPQPKLWYPAGAGEQNLYKLRIKVSSGGVSREIVQKVGIRDIVLIKNENSSADSLPYTFTVNDKRIYAKGFDWVPLDINYGSVGAGRYERMIRALAECNVNMVRVWGGGLIESEIFYDLCDRYGIMVWQDFIQSSSGIDNYPAQDEKYLKLLKKTSEYAVKKKRNHPSLAAFCGGNELYDSDYRPVGFENKNLAMLRDIVSKNSDIFLFPASPSGGSAGADYCHPEKCHDIHGPWQVFGRKDGEDYYEYYNRKTCLFHSEFGSDGLSDFRTLKKILSPKNRGVFDNRNDVWRHRGEWWNTLSRDRAVFGDEIGSLKDFITASQFLQAETLRYAAEADRRAAFVNSGSFVWQFNEPVPNVSCTSVVDYYGYKKAAYFTVRHAYACVNPSLRYQKMVYDSGETENFTLFVTSDLCEQEIDCKCTITAGEILLFESKDKVEVGGGKSVLVREIPIVIPDEDALRICLQVCLQSGKEYKNEILLPIRKKGKSFASLKPVYKFLEELKREKIKPIR